MKKILFICHGNICRSPMAEFIMKDLVREQGIADLFAIESAATTSEEICRPVYPPAKRMLETHGIDCSGKRARKITVNDYDDFDLLIIMDRENLWHMNRYFPKDPGHKIHMLREYCGDNKEIDDPWYTGDFQGVYEQIWEGCTALLAYLLEQK